MSPKWGHLNSYFVKFGYFSPIFLKFFRKLRKLLSLLLVNGTKKSVPVGNLEIWFIQTKIIIRTFIGSSKLKVRVVSCTQHSYGLISSFYEPSKPKKGELLWVHQKVKLKLWHYSVYLRISLEFSNPNPNLNPNTTIKLAETLLSLKNHPPTTNSNYMKEQR